MSNPRLDYYCDAVSESFDEHGITATREQIKAVARDMELARDCESQAFYQPENPLIAENTELRRKLSKEQNKRGCRVCGGSGRIIAPFGPVGRVSDSQCDACRGEGKVTP